MGYLSFFVALIWTLGTCLFGKTFNWSDLVQTYFILNIIVLLVEFIILRKSEDRPKGSCVSRGFLLVMRIFLTCLALILTTLFPQTGIVLPTLFWVILTLSILFGIF